MSKVGKKIVAIPAKTTVSVESGRLNVSGPGGVLERTLRPEVEIVIADNTATVTNKSNTKQGRALWGTTTAHLLNMVSGVNKPFVKKLVIEGIGYRAELSGAALQLQLGFSHPVRVDIPKGLTVAVEKNEMTISGADVEMVGQFSAKIRALKKPEPYKGKGIRYHTEVIRRKQGKKAMA